MKNKLYIVGTPIGNLSDLSPRGVETLKNVDIIYAEDTRITAKLLNFFEIHTKLESFYEQIAERKTPEIIANLQSGLSVALVSDAGMPCISDPGRVLVDAALSAEIAVETVPGPTALATAIALSGFNCSRFCFEGFLSVNKRQRYTHLEQLKSERRAIVFYEAPHKLVRTLADMHEYFGDRQVALIKELTKIYEQVWRGGLAKAAQLFGEEHKPKGEYVIVLAPLPEAEDVSCTLADAVKIAIDYGGSPSAGAKEAAKITNIPKSLIYKELLK